MDNTAVNPEQGEPAARRRGDKHRQAIMGAVRELLQEKPFAELSVSAISLRAGVARSGFYFYFDSKYSVLAQIMAEAAEELEERTHYFAPRQPGESPGAVRQTDGGQCGRGLCRQRPGDGGL